MSDPSTSCGSVSDVDAIKLAKQAAAKISNHPFLFGDNGRLGDKSGLIEGWPDQQGSILTQGGGSTYGFSVGVTLTTQAVSSGSGWDITFEEQWNTPDVSGRLPQHSWLFHVSDDSKANFIKEQGDPLPQMRG